MRMPIVPEAPLPPTPESHDVLSVPDLQALLEPGRRDVQRARQVFVNRNLRMERIDLVGFDMDYTLAIYQKRSIFSRLPKVRSSAGRRVTNSGSYGSPGMAGGGPRF